MRCELKYDSELPFADQSVDAWGEYQQVEKDDPCYKETDLNTSNYVFFSHYKQALDDAYGEFEAMFEQEYESEITCREFKDRLSRALCLLLFSLIDDQDADY